MPKETEIKIVRSAECPSLSSNTSIKFSIGWDGNNLMLRIDDTTSTGHFNSLWVNENDILDVFNTAQEPFSSSVLQSFFRGKSVNSAYFIMGVAKHLNLVATAPDNSRKFVRGNPKEFHDSVRPMIKPPPKKSPSRKNTQTATKEVPT